MRKTSVLLAAVGIAVSLTTIKTANAHCDSMDGPVVTDARTALEQRDVTPVLKWVKADDSPAIKAAFARTIAVRTAGPEARELADQFFFETLVRIHRAGEGAGFTGLKPVGAHVEPGIEAADKAVKEGVVEPLAKALADDVAEGVRKRYARVAATKAHAAHSVEAGREYVAAYVEFIHYVEALQQKAAGSGLHHEGAGGAPTAEHAHTTETAHR